MDIKRIVVDELPSQCLRCKYFRIAYTTLPDMDFCNVMNKYMDSEDIHTRPSWCPLQVEDECVWVREKTERGYAAFYIPKDHEQHIDCYTQDAGTYDYCPTCGKTIKYVESEQ